MGRFKIPSLRNIALTAPYMHDGSAATVEDAILAHGGEAQAIRDAFEALNAQERAPLIEFLETR